MDYAYSTAKICFFISSKLSLLQVLVLFLTQTTNLFYFSVGINVTVLIIHSFHFFIWLGYAEGVPSETWIYSSFHGS